MSSKHPKPSLQNQHSNREDSVKHQRNQQQMADHSEYIPRINDYVKWRNVEGWVYYVDFDHITIEISVRKKHPDDIANFPLHKKHHCLVVCNEYDWNELEYIHTRRFCNPNDLSEVETYIRE